MESVASVPLVIVRVGEHVVSLGHVAAAHWEGETLYVHLVGGRFVSFNRQDGDLLWEALCGQAVDLKTGEVGGKP